MRRCLLQHLVRSLKKRLSLRCWIANSLEVVMARNQDHKLVFFDCDVCYHLLKCNYGQVCWVRVVDSLDK